MFLYGLRNAWLKFPNAPDRPVAVIRGAVTATTVAGVQRPSAPAKSRAACRPFRSPHDQISDTVLLGRRLGHVRLFARAVYAKQTKKGHSRRAEFPCCVGVAPPVTQ
jgi:hypothetical protein